MCPGPHQNKGRGWRRKTGLSPPVKYFPDRSKAVLLLWIFYVFVLSCVVLGHFGHGHFGLGRFGLDISATDVSATENVEGGRFGHNHKFWVWDVCMHKKVMHFISF